MINKKELAKKIKPLKDVWQKNQQTKFVVLFAVLVIFGLLLVKNKSLFVAATVNGRPVWRWTLESKLVSRYGDQTLDEITSEVLIQQAAESKGITATSVEISQKITDIEKSLSGKIALKDALAQQGMTMEDLRSQIKLQILMEKMTASQITVSGQEIVEYLEKNKSLITATETGAMNEEAKKALTDSKKNTLLRQLFADLKAKAKISKYL